MTMCECSSPGYCSRHGITKSPHWWRMCRSREDLLRSWDRGLGPGQSPSADLNGQLIAPLRNSHVREKPWEGACFRKPWNHHVCAVVPVLDTPETLQVVIELLRLQTEPPFIVVVDTGSQPDLLLEIEGFRTIDVEVHSLRLNGVRHPSDFPAMAMDLAFAICRSPYLFATHADCFLRSRTLLAEMLQLCKDKSPVVGYQLSPRSHPDWQGMVGHTCTMFDMSVMDRIGAGWSMRRLATLFNIHDHQPHPDRPNWPDTELLLNYLIRQHQIIPHLIGREENFVRHRDSNIDHCRSLTGALLYNPQHFQRAREWAEEAMTEARQRIQTWTKEIAKSSG